MTAGAQGNLEYLAFHLGQEEYALNIQQVQEIRSYEPATHIAAAPDYLKGLINLRGAIVPIVDLRMKLGVGQPTYDGTTAVVITNTRDKTVGFVVDRVNDVMELGAEQLQPLPDMGSEGTAHITGLGVTDDRTLILVDAEKLFGE
jgi:purine-binding chemotaxis protein CheW